MPFGQRLHHAVLAILMAHFVGFKNKQTTNSCYKPNTEKGGQPHNVHQGKKNHKQHHTCCQVPDVLRFEAFEFNGLVDCLVDLINTITHKVFSLNPKKGFNNGGHHYQKHAASKPGRGNFSSIRVTCIPFLVHLYCPYESQ